MTDTPCASMTSTSDGVWIPGSDYFKLGIDKKEDKARPVMAIVLGSGRSLWNFHDLRKRAEALGPEHLVIIGVNYSYRMYLAENHLFLDWEFWSQNCHDVVKMVNDFDVQMFAPIHFDPKRMENSPAPPMPPNIHRFNPFICMATGCKGCKTPLSKHPVLGLRGSATSSMPSINLAYLSGAPIIAIIGIEMDQSYHFWQTKRWHEEKTLMPHYDDWHKLFIDIYGARQATDKFPNADYSLSDLKKVGKWLRRKEKIRAVNVAECGAVQGWERMSLASCLDLAEELKDKKLRGEYPPTKKPLISKIPLLRRFANAAAL